MRQYGLLAIVLLGLLLRIAYALAIYEPSLLSYHGGDYTLYRVTAEDIAQGDFAFQNSSYLLRPPLFPLLVAALDLQPLLIIAVNILLSTGVIPLAYALAQQLGLRQKPALLCALIVSLDPTSIKYAGVLLAEPLAAVLLALAYVIMMKLARTQRHSSILAWGAMSGTFMALSAWTRPSAYLLWIPMALWVLVARRGGGGGALLAAIALSAPAALGYGLWTQHNAQHFNNSSYTTIGTWNLLYGRAASVLYQATGDDIETVYLDLARRVEQALGNDLSGVSADWRYRHYAPNASQQETMAEVALEVVWEHPLFYLLTIPVGLYRMLLQVNGMLLLTGIVWNALLLLAAATGIAQLLMRRAWLNALFLLLPCAYFVTGTLLVCTSCADSRARVMLTPLLAVMAALGAMRWLRRRKLATEDTESDEDAASQP